MSNLQIQQQAISEEEYPPNFNQNLDLSRSSSEVNHYLSDDF